VKYRHLTIRYQLIKNKKMKSIYFFLILFLFSVVKTTAQTDEQGILLAVNNYLDGGTNGDVKQFESAFVNEAIQRSIGSNGEVIGMTVKSLALKLKPGQVMSRETRIVSLNYAGIAATATTETIYPTSKIIDLLNLLKINGEWKIVSRVYSRIGPDEEVTSSGGSIAKPATKTAAKPATPKKKPVADDGW
jgi:hypothetical protein